MMDSKDIIYRVNDQDEIIFVNEEWDQFAVANEGEGVTSSQILHRPLWDFIVDSTTRELYQQVLTRIRDGRLIHFTFRCDSPSSRRLLEMEIGHGEDNSIEFRTHTLCEKSRATISLLEPRTARSDELLRVCSWCKKVFVDGSWIEVEEAVDQLSLFRRDLLPSMTHGICPDCAQKMRKTLAATLIQIE